MKSINIHNVSNELDQCIAAKAEEWAISPGETIKKLLEAAFTPPAPELIQFYRNWNQPGDEEAPRTDLKVQSSCFMDDDEENESIRIYLVEPA